MVSLMAHECSGSLAGRARRGGHASQHPPFGVPNVVNISSIREHIRPSERLLLRKVRPPGSRAMCGRTNRAAIFPLAAQKEKRMRSNVPVTPEDSTSAWMSLGNCRNYPPATFFPSDGVGVDRARKICNGCPVLD